ncbi:DAK2 domain-containing protein [Nocardia sp. 348MFTsu5.1]|uniref:DAK2 domain-containing protein n=1 Tax=Nocardia sp. 348MFTsu5.1 TaxID=1172185 RepID=UPI0005657E79|nr:DAK2 domain-containing protein [Nocardia sp. 348MFTsu5.1]
MDPGVLRDWIHGAVTSLDAVRAEINDLNVFPIPDSDTGSNMLHTMRSAAQAVDALDDEADTPTVARAMAEGAVAKARGNSGIILSQVLVGLADAAEINAVERRVSFNSLWVAGLRLASLAATRAVSEPREGTVLTLLRRSAENAAGHAEATPADLARAIADGCADDLELTQSQLDVLAQAGVVDAGGRGLLVIFDELVKVLTGVSVRRRRYQGALVGGGDRIGHQVGEPCEGDDEMDFEVMYLLGGAAPDQISTLRTNLGELGDAVVIVGDSADDGAGERFSIHVHTCEPGAAIEAGVALGRVSDIRISCFLLDSYRGQGDKAPRPPRRKRAVIAVVTGDEAAELFEQEGAVVVRADAGGGGELDAEVLAKAIIDVDSAHVILMGNGALPAPDLVAVAAAARSRERSVVILPGGSMVQSLAAMAVHDPSELPDDDAYAMADAAAATRFGAVVTATERTLTFAGTCEPGDHLGLIGDGVLVIHPEIIGAAAGLVDLLLSTGGEMVSVLAGRNLEPEVLEQLEHHVNTQHPGVEFVSFPGGQVGELLQVGVE